MSRISVRSGTTRQPSATAAIGELCEQMVQPAMGLAIIFVSPAYDLDALGPAIAAHFPCPVLSCTTAGELSGAGYAQQTLSGVTIASPELRAQVEFIPSLAAFVGTGDLTSVPEGPARGVRRFGLTLLDGLSMLEEPVTALIQAKCGEMPVIGGSAADGLRFGSASIYHGGAFHTGAGVLCVVETSLPFATFMVQQFRPTSTRLVITDATPATRCVSAINGAPAATEFARIVRVRRSDLSPAVFAANPVMVKVGGEYYVRSILCANPDDSLTFYCAIDSGLVLTLARPTPLVDALERSLASLRATLPSMSLLLGFDCVLRRLEVEATGETARLASAVAEYPLCGFSTYGEQYKGLHMNHTLTGVGLGA